MRGRKPTPADIKALRGNPGRRKLPPEAPTPASAESLAPPAWLSKAAKTRWRELAGELERVGLLTRIDLGALAQYCQVWARWQRAEVDVAKRGQVIRMRTKSGRWYQAQNPYVSLANRALIHVRGLEAEFGMTPAARSRVQVRTFSSAAPTLAASSATAAPAFGDRIPKLKPPDDSRPH